MQTDPIAEWRRLTEHYRALGEGELRALALDFHDLTEMAQQSLRAELHSRRLGDPETLAQEPALPARAAAPPGTAADTGDAAAESGDESDGPHEYTWKTLLCECGTGEHAWQIAEALRRAGIESWIDGPGRYSPHPDLDVTNPRVLVAADQLDQARVILAQPIPQDIVDESRQTPADFVAPACPGCGAADPALEGADPVNAWRCEVCGREWVDGVPAAQEEPQKRTFGFPAAVDGKSRPATGQLYPQGE